MRKLKDFDLKRKKVLLRCDFNVPLSKGGAISDDFKIKESLPTIEYLIDQDAKIVLVSHLGRPEGKVLDGLRLDPVAKKLEERLNTAVLKLNESVGREVRDRISSLKEREILLLENIQFNPGEKEKDPEFIEELSSYADFFVFDAFGQSHRDYASISGVAEKMPSAAGLLMEKEINILSRVKDAPERPLVSIIGGKKIETKLDLINKFSALGDKVIINGILEKEMKSQGVELDFPDKVLFPVDDIGDGLDIGEESVELFDKEIAVAKTIFWNGPFGAIEQEKFKKGTEMIAKAISRSKAFSLVGGGETIGFLNELGIRDNFSHVSTGGGAMLCFLSGGALPGLEALND